MDRPEWLEQLVADSALEPRPSAWMDVPTLPKIVVGGRVATIEEILALLQAMPALAEGLLKANAGLVPGFQPPAWTSGFRRDGEKTTRDNFMEALQQRFNAAERPSKDRWVYMAVALFGGDRCALRLGPQVRQMAEDMNRAGANRGIDLLRSIGTDTAIMQLDMLARKVRRNSVKVRAQTAVNEIAAQRQLTLDQLGDRIIPDCGLDADGQCVFDFGGRRFSLVIGKGLKPQIRDESGQSRDDLPQPRSSDDPVVAAESVAKWKLLRKSFKDTLKLQAERLELAMILGREWSMAEFRQFFADHPVMRHLARLIVWGEYDTQHRLLRSFRLAEDSSLCDEHDVTTVEPERVRVVHPLHLSANSRAAWGQVLSDYELLPPFDQLNRSVHLPEADEIDQDKLTRFEGRRAHPMSLLSTLTKLGWQVGEMGDGGHIQQHRKTHADGTVAVLDYSPGIPIQYPAAAEVQTLERCEFFPTAESAAVAYHQRTAMPLKTVPVMVFSECVRDLMLLTARSDP